MRTAARLLSSAATQFMLSARAYHRVLKLARTIADLDDSPIIRRIHLAEALTYRWRDPGPAIRMPPQSQRNEERINPVVR